MNIYTKIKLHTLHCGFNAFVHQCKYWILISKNKNRALSVYRHNYPLNTSGNKLKHTWARWWCHILDRSRALATAYLCYIWAGWGYFVCLFCFFSKHAQSFLSWRVISQRCALPESAANHSCAFQSTAIPLLHSLWRALLVEFKQCLECSQSTPAVGLESQNDVDVLYLFKPLEFHSILLQVSEHIAV